MNIRAWFSAIWVMLALSLTLLPRTAIGQGSACIENTGWVSQPSISVSNNSPYVTLTADGYFKTLNDGGTIPLVLDVAIWLDGTPFALLSTRPASFSGAISEIKMVYNGTLPPLSPGSHTIKWFASDSLANATSAAPYQTAPGVTVWNQSKTFSTTTAYPGPVGGGLIRPVPGWQSDGWIQPEALSYIYAQADAEFYSESGSPALDQMLYVGSTQAGGTPVWTTSTAITGHGPFSNPNNGFTAVSDKSSNFTLVTPYEYLAIQHGTTNVLWDIIVYY